MCLRELPRKLTICNVFVPALWASCLPGCLAFLERNYRISAPRVQPQPVDCSRSYPDIVWVDAACLRMVRGWP